MHTEHLSNVRPSWIAFGWFVCAAFTALVLFGLLALRLVPWDGTGGSGWVLLAFALGFFAGGYLTGARVGGAPILHAVGIGLFSVLAWLLANLFGEALGLSGWQGLGPVVTAGLLLLQIAAAAAGARLGSRASRRAVP